MRGGDWRKSTITEIIMRLLEFFKELVSDFKEANRNFTYIFSLEEGRIIIRKTI
jgi:predicted transcriptional regulator